MLDKHLWTVLCLVPCVCDCDFSKCMPCKGNHTRSITSPDWGTFSLHAVRFIFFYFILIVLLWHTNMIFDSNWQEIPILFTSPYVLAGKVVLFLFQVAFLDISVNRIYEEWLYLELMCVNASSQVFPTQEACGLKTQHTLLWGLGGAKRSLQFSRHVCTQVWRSVLKGIKLKWFLVTSDHCSMPCCKALQMYTCAWVNTDLSY